MPDRPPRSGRHASAYDPQRPQSWTQGIPQAKPPGNTWPRHNPPPGRALNSPQLQHLPPPGPFRQHGPPFPLKPTGRARMPLPRDVVAGLPRATTFKRQQEEKRENLKPCGPGRRAKTPSGKKRRSDSSQHRPASDSPAASSRREASPEVETTTSSNPEYTSWSRPHSRMTGAEPSSPGSDGAEAEMAVSNVAQPQQTDRVSEHDDEAMSDDGSLSDGFINPQLRQELESRWILNLSMAFRDKSNREKFFVTFAEKPNMWRRVTVSCDYAGAPPDSLEAALQSLRYPRDKSAHIYEAIRDSLHTIQFYDTVTNLKLETADGRLHVHVTEDINEIIRYPPLTAIGHLRLDGVEIVTESQVNFLSHLSGFVYKVGVGKRQFIKKEIPGPDMVEEFLYEVNALYTLRNSRDVIDLHGIVVDETRTKITGLLISYAEKGTLVDLIYDHKEEPLSWERRDKWAKQIVCGLAAIHEAGFVQGDFTLSNIVIDRNDDAKIIDINRRGCPMGWEPPEFMGLIESGQRIGMYIGVKSDTYQLGMVLWAMATLEDEPERHEKPLEINVDTTQAPEYFKEWAELCLKDNPAERWSARDLLEKPIEGLGRMIEYPTPEPTPGDRQIGHDLQGMDHLEPALDIPADIPELQEMSKNFNELASEGFALPKTRPQASKSISGRDVLDCEPVSFDETPYERPSYPSRRSAAHVARRVPSFPPVDRPIHQDSGLGDEDHENVDMLRGHAHLRAPAHQDSGYSDLMDPATISTDCTGMEDIMTEPTSTPMAFAGIGAHARGR